MNRTVAIHNPHGTAVGALPVIYGFNNGGEPGWFDAQLLAQDGTFLGGHLCSSEAFMPGDLGVLEGSRPDRHEGFRKHYPDGYRMEFVGYDQVPTHSGLMAAIDLAKIAQRQSEEAERSVADEAAAASADVGLTPKITKDTDND